MPGTRALPDPEGRSTEPADAPSATDGTTAVVRLHNYDHWDGHSVDVTVAPAGGEPVLRERRYLHPGRSACLRAAIEPGEHELRVSVDGVERDRRTCRLDGSASGTAVVELGNGVVSVTDGATRA